MIDHNPVTNEPGQCIALARGAAGIYLALMQSGLPAGSSVIVPANLCYAGIYPVSYAGLKPVFCDVDADTGNVTLETFCQACTEETASAIVPHMYGNPVEQMPEIQTFCKKRQILLIEDCASAMGAASDGYVTGTMGDYVVYSTGYSKTMDLGFGGFLYSSRYDLAEAEKMEALLPELKPENEENMTFFSRLYRLMRNEGRGTPIEKMIYRGLAQTCRDDFLHRISQEKKQWLFSQTEQLPQVIQARRNALRHYEKNLRGSSVRLYPYSEMATPWRFNIFLEGDARRELIRSCLEKSLPVSDWYPRVTNLFDCEADFPGARKHEQQILNFPLLITGDEIDRICNEILRFADGQKAEV